MKIAIIAMDDPLYTNSFVKQIINARKKDIVKFVYVSKGNRMTLSHNKSKFEYILSMFLIMGPIYFIKNALSTFIHKTKQALSKNISFIKSPLVIEYAKELNIDTTETKNPNSKKLLKELILKLT